MKKENKKCCPKDVMSWLDFDLFLLSLVFIGSLISVIYYAGRESRDHEVQVLKNRLYSRCIGTPTATLKECNDEWVTE